VARGSIVLVLIWIGSQCQHISVETIHC
jgi:hypothetical protein